MYILTENVDALGGSKPSPKRSSWDKSYLVLKIHIKLRCTKAAFRDNYSAYLSRILTEDWTRQVLFLANVL